MIMMVTCKINLFSGVVDYLNNLITSIKLYHGTSQMRVYVTVILTHKLSTGGSFKSVWERQTKLHRHLNLGIDD